jgi:hypothetical protein
MLPLISDVDSLGSCRCDTCSQPFESSGGGRRQLRPVLPSQP